MRSVAHETTTLKAIKKLDTTVCLEKGRKTTVRVPRARAPLRAGQALVSAPERDKRYTGSEQILHSV